MKLIQTAIQDVVIIEPAVFADERGWFMESFNEKRFHEELQKLGIETPKPFVQDNHSCSIKGVLRGLHFQSENTQGKLVRVIKGEVFDVAVDIRRNSPTFGKWVGEFISEDNKKQLWIPEGLAHGFFVISDLAQFEYKCTDYYNPSANVTILWNDLDLAIKWPIKNSHVCLSNQDKNGKTLKECVEAGLLI